MRLTMNLDDELVSHVEEYALKMHINRTAAISVLLSQALSANAGIDALVSLNSMVQAEQLQASSKA